MTLSEPSVIKISFFPKGQLDECVKACEMIVESLRLKPSHDIPEKIHLKALLQDFSKEIASTNPSSEGNLWVIPFHFDSETCQLRIWYFLHEKDEKTDVSDGIFYLVAVINSNSEEITQEWKMLEGRLPENLPVGEPAPITIYFALSDKDVEFQDVIPLADALFPSIAKNPNGYILHTRIYCGMLYKVSYSETYFLFSPKEKEKDAVSFIARALPLFNIFSYFGNSNTHDKEGKLQKAVHHMKEVSQRLTETIVCYSKRELGSLKGDEEKTRIFNLAEDLMVLNHNAGHFLNLKESVNITLKNYRNLKEKHCASQHKDEIFCQKEKALESQMDQVQADATYMKNVFESGKVALDSIANFTRLEYIRELKESNKKSLSLQTAALLIEFFIVFYYFLGSWHYILDKKFEEFPTIVRFLCALVMALSLCAATHFFAEYLHTKKKRYLTFVFRLSIPIISVLCYIIIVVVWFQRH